MQDNSTASGRGRPRKTTGAAEDTRADFPFAVAFGAILAKLRADGGITQQQLADRSGVSIDTIQQYEAGRRSPKLDQAGKLVAALGLSLAVLDGLFAAAAQRPSR